jgi:[protein-PII] uridylyltransferase
MTSEWSPLAAPGGAIRAARERSAAVDSLVAGLLAELTPESGPLSLVALGAYGRQELTPRAEVELLFLHAPGVSVPAMAEAVWSPLSHRTLRIEPILRTLNECVAEAGHSFSAATRFLNARLIAGDIGPYADLVRRIAQPLRRDQPRLRRRLLASVQRRHAAHAPVTASAAPDLLDGRGGLHDLEALRWLDPLAGRRLRDALDVLLRAVTLVESIGGHASHRLTLRVQERVAAMLGSTSEALLDELYQHARRVAFQLDGVLASPPPDRSLGASIHIRDGHLVGDRLPALERSPILGLRVANLVGLAPPHPDLLDWASAPGPPLHWDASTHEQLWLLLRAADWRAWEFLDVTGLVDRHLPELATIRRRRVGTTAQDLALDVHSFLALRRLHEWIESEDPLAERVWRTIRHRDWLYLAVLLHELEPQRTEALVDRLGLAQDAQTTIARVVADAGLLAEIATRRDLQDEDALLDVAARIGSRQRLGMQVLVSVAHDLALPGGAWTPWQADLVRQLFGVLESMLRRRGEIGPRRSRSIEHRRQRVAQELRRRNLEVLLPMVAQLPRRYLLARSPAFIARHLALAGREPLGDGEVRIEARRHRQPGVWEILVVARDRPGLLATVAGVLALRGTSVLAADAATSTEGLVLDVFTVTSAYGAPLEASLWPHVASDLQMALAERLPLADLLATPSERPERGTVRVTLDNAASQVFSVVEVRAPDQVGLLYRITRTLHDLGLDVHHAKIATLPSGALDVFYVWDAAGQKLDEARAERVVESMTAALS